MPRGYAKQQHLRHNGAEQVMIKCRKYYRDAEISRTEECPETLFINKKIRSWEAKHSYEAQSKDIIPKGTAPEKDTV